MSKKPYVSPETLEYQNKQKRQNKILLKLLILIFIPPLLLFPIYPKNDGQYAIYEYITENMFITVGTKGPLPFFTILSSIYITIIMFFFACYFCWVFIKKYGVNKEFQQKIYSLFFQAEFSYSHKYPFLEKPFIKKTLVSSIFLLCFLGSIIHFLQDKISFQSGNRRGALIEFSYNYRIGVLLWESIISLFLIFPIFYFGLLTLYLINYFLRGIGSGKIIIPQQKNKKRKRRNK